MTQELSLQQIFEEIYNLQAQLNQHIGRDTLNCPIEKSAEWIFDYLWALHDEATELANCFRWKWWDTKVRQNPELRYELYDYKNAKIELIDMIHFFISLCQIVFGEGIDSAILADLLFDTENFEKYDEKNKSKNFINVVIIVSKVATQLDKIISNTFQREPFDLEDFSIPIFILARYISYLISMLEMSPQEVLEVYCKKCKVNFERQNQQYSMDNKTEEDNENIAKTLN
jgi:hypothetical protein